MISLVGKKILIVDDEKLLREVLRDGFVDCGANVAEAENGNRALEMLKKERFDAVISDVKMPGGDGIFLMGKIKEQGGDKPKCFLCSGFDFNSEQIRAMGVVKVFSKPFNEQEILEIVSDSLKSKPTSAG